MRLIPKRGGAGMGVGGGGLRKTKDQLVEKERFPTPVAELPH